jgi:hypothetical protein
MPLTLTRTAATALARLDGVSIPMPPEVVVDGVLYPGLHPVRWDAAAVACTVPRRWHPLSCVECGGGPAADRVDALDLGHAVGCDTGAEAEQLRRRDLRRLRGSRAGVRRDVAEVEVDALASVGLPAPPGVRVHPVPGHRRRRQFVGLTGEPALRCAWPAWPRIGTTTFADWLAGQAHRGDDVGALARDFVEDRNSGCCHSGLITAAQVWRHIDKAHPLHGVRDAVAVAHAEHQQHTTRRTTR